MMSRAQLRIFAAILVMAATQLSVAADPYRAGYQLSVQVAGDTWQVQTRAPFSASDPIRHEFGAYEVTMELDPVSASTYHMTVRVRESDSLRSVLLEHTFEGSFDGVLEFSFENSAAGVSGAIAVGAIR